VKKKMAESIEEMAERLTRQREELLDFLGQWDPHEAVTIMIGVLAAIFVNIHTKERHEIDIEYVNKQLRHMMASYLKNRPIQ
jgi:hypothetical protein